MACLMGMSGGAFAQQASPQTSPGHQLPSPDAVALRTEEAIVVDAVFDEKSWSLAHPVTDFIQRDPKEGAPASERTEVRILFNARTLYLGIKCYDSNPAGIVATELRRDGEMEGDDIFEVIFDTFHDHRNGYRFRVNPLGTQRDQSVSGEGQSVNDNWDEKWDSKARITSEGWVAEIAIPFKSMRFAGRGGSVWGMNLHRTIIRKNEDVFWSGYNRGYTLTKISGSGHLEGLSGIRGFRFRVKPYIAAKTIRSPGTGEKSTHTRGEIGVEDAKYLIRPQLTLDAAVNPDFAQADVDQALVNLSRFSLFFPEKREFFQEGSGIFQFGTGNRFGAVTDLLLFHSRRVGISADREEIPILGGVKLTGTQGPLEVGLLNMQTDREEANAGQNFTVLRLKSNVLARSYVGAILTRNTGSPLGGSNRALGLDSIFNFFRYLNLQGFLAKTFSTGLDNKDWAGKAAVRWANDRTVFSFERLQIDENFRPEMGFVRRAQPRWKGLQQTQAEAGYKPRPKMPWVRQFGVSGKLDYLANREGLLETRDGKITLTGDFKSGDILTTTFGPRFESLVNPFRIGGGGGTVSAGDYRFNEFSMKYTAHRGRRIAGTLEFSKGGFFDGAITGFDISPAVKPNARLSLAPSFRWNRIARQNSTFITRELNTQVNYSLSRKWLTRTTLAWNSQNKETLVNFRLNYIFRPGDDLFFVYSESHNYGEANGLINRAFIVKLTYSLDL
ncbi:MAG: carbohydrate binding family 9 domain-containing protein [Acidobacteria bacterium]|nr:carbohydrate binding family 9 domain-containing protein [Acidobacteriota bacterium]